MHGVRLKPTRHLWIHRGTPAWGLPDLVDLVRRAAERVAIKHKGPVMLVGDLSAKDGGPLGSHRSHQSGRDADVAFYSLDRKGRPSSPSRIVAFGPNGLSYDGSGLRFDDARNWTLVETLLRDERARVRYVFIAPGLRARLLRTAAEKKAPAWLIERAQSVLVSDNDDGVHDNHCHVRISCPDAMRTTCIEESVGRPPADRGAEQAAAGQSPGEPSAEQLEAQPQEQGHDGSDGGADGELQQPPAAAAP